MRTGRGIGRFREGLRAAAELALGSVCAGCGGSSGLLCGTCRDAMAGPAWLALQQPEGLRVAAVASYEGTARAVVLGHKERGRLALAGPLGEALAVSVAAVVETPGGCPLCGTRPLALVPAPSAR